MKSKKMLVSLMVVIICLFLAVFFARKTFCRGSILAQSQSVEKREKQKDLYEVNKHGETYGRQIYGTEEEPDLIQVTATNGQEGYIRQSDIDKYAGGNVKTPEEAMEYQNKSEQVIKIPVYDKEGENVVGFFELSDYGDKSDERSSHKKTKKAQEVLLSTHMGSKKKVKGYKYSYYIKSGVYCCDGSEKGYCAGIVSIRNTKQKNVPAGYMGVLPRLYNKTGKLVVSGKWNYNGTPCLEKRRYTSNVKGNGKYYYGASKVRVYNGNGYNTYTCNQSPYIKVVCAKKPVYKVNSNGEIYGSGINDEALGGEPDLIEAVGIGGVKGYVKAKDFEIGNVTPKVAASNSKKEMTSYETINLYDREGKVIGKFKIDSNLSEEVVNS